MTVLDRRVSRLEVATSLQLATVRPDGRPHLVPLWFDWDGETLVVLSKAHAQKVKNIRAEPRAMVNVGEPGSVGTSLLEVTGEVGAARIADIADRFALKYHRLLEGLGRTTDEFLQTYPTVIRLRPSRWLSWGAPGWEQGDGEPSTGCQRA
jgi:PPOX class probable F420-dependent enzyme